MGDEGRGFRAFFFCGVAAQKAVIRHPLSVYRASHRMTAKVFMHGSRSTINEQQLYV